MADFLGISSDTPSISDLTGSVGAIADSILGDFLDTLTGDTKYKKLYNQTESQFKQYSETQADRRQWAMIPTDTSTASYFFLLKYKGKTIQIPFNVNPQRETITEPHASTTQFTQGGGKIVHSEGSLTKDITIQGMCGVYPGERRIRLPDSGIGSGFEAFKFLQNTFRRYTFLKRYGDLSQGLQLIYVNRRRQESWVVEPKSFTSEDATEHNNNFSYTIVLETLYPYDGSDAKGLVENLFDSIPGWRQFDAVVQRLSEAVDQVNAAAGKISSIVNGFGATVMSRVVALANSFADVKAGRLPNLTNFKRDSVKSIVSQLADTHSALEGAHQTDLAIKVAKLQRAVTATLLQDNQFDSSPTSKAISTTALQRNQSSSFLDANGVSVSPDDAKAAGVVSQRPDATKVLGGSATAPASTPGSETLQAANAAKQSAVPTTVATIGGSALDPNGKFQVTRISTENNDSTAVPPLTRTMETQANWDASWDQALSNIDPARADYQTSTIQQDDSIQTLSFRLLGDHARWPELVLLNNLQYPYVADAAYIAANNLTGVLPYYGGMIYPVPKRNSTARTRVWRNETFTSLSLDAFQRSLGNDILIDETSGDIVWGANDIELVYGVSNLRQFMRKRLTLKKGTLRRSPRVGFSDYIGVSQGALESLIKAEAQTIFFGDDRIASTDVVIARQTAQVLEVGAIVTVKDAEDPIAVQAALT